MEYETKKNVAKKCTCCGLEKKETKFALKKGIYSCKGINRFDECKDCQHIKYKKNIIENHGIKYWKKLLLKDFENRLRTRTRCAFKKIKENKPAKTEELLGCSWIEAKEHIESYFDEKINWDNFNDWHIDHIMPLCSAKTSDELVKLCRYTNLQPLMAIDNIRKGGKY
tara:strand:- start:53 stop:556 length:504 start_codon:yes stop_codon:yes gene_type:complete